MELRGAGLVTVHMMSFDPSTESAPGARTVYSVAISRYNPSKVEEYMTHIVGVCAAGQERACAGKIVAVLDEVVVSTIAFYDNK